MSKCYKINYINCMVQEIFGCAVAFIEARLTRNISITIHKEATCTNNTNEKKCILSIVLQYCYESNKNKVRYNSIYGKDFNTPLISFWIQEDIMSGK